MYKTDMDGGKIAVIDGNSLVFRAFFAIRNAMITSRGVYTHAIFGFLNMLFKALGDVKPDYIAVAFDRKAPTFRHLEYDAYKAGRAKTPDELVVQLPYLKEVLDAMRITVLEMDGFEADDLIGTVAKHAERAGLETLVITGDRDELQLVSENISVLLTKRGVSEFELYTPELMLEKYGFGAEFFVDYKGLMGDTSDNIPGLPGVGEKTAAKLVQKFGPIENIVANLDEVEPERIRGIIEENVHTAFLSKRLATIVTNAPIEIDLEAMRVRDWDIERLRELYTELEFRNFLKRLPPPDENAGAEGAKGTGEDGTRQRSFAATGGEAEHDAGEIAYDPKGVEISMIEDVEGLEAAREALAGAGEAVLHTIGSKDHVEKPVVDAIHVYVNGRYFCIWSRGDDGLLSAACEMLAAVDVGLMGFGLKDDLYRIRRTLAGGGDRSAAIAPKAQFDIGVANYLLAPGGAEPTFAQLAFIYGGLVLREPPDFSKDILSYGREEIAEQGREFCVAASALVPVLRQRLEAAGAAELFDEVEMPLTDTLSEMEALGFSYDAAAMDEIAGLITERIDVLKASITELAGTAFNINSPKQLGEVLFEKLGLPGGKKNKSGYSTSADVLDKLKDDYPIAEQALEYRMLVKLKGTYIDGLPVFVAKDGKIRAHLQQTIAATGRLSCADPNLQNIPIRKEPGRQLRRAFIPESDDHVLMSADYSQIELRVLAHLSGDPALIDDFRKGADIHSSTAVRIFGLPNADEVTIAQRSGAKAVNFGIIYGMSSFGLSEELAITRKDAERYIEDYFRQHEAVKAYMDRCVAGAKENGYTTTIMGRRRPIPEVLASQFMVRQLGERLAMNSPVQGSAADIIKVAMNRVRAALAREGLATALILQVHDELILQVKKGEEEVAAEILKREMEGAVDLRVPLEVDVKTGTSWFELK
ncbi:MAG: DNA polymerase I [Clostridiales bacterium]|nr:DNA polymerase I [Clostridiales bacterium]